MSSHATNYISVEEYLDRERQSSDRHEYLNGRIFAMAGGTPAHSAIASNVIAELNLRLRDSDCIVRNSDMLIRSSDLYTYADVVVSCAGEQIENNVLLNPVVIVEVLSDSTQGYDRGLKFEKYRSIPSFKEYLLIAQDRRYVELHVRSGAHKWTMCEYAGLNDVIALAAIDVSIASAEIYRKIVFSGQ